MEQIKKALGFLNGGVFLTLENKISELFKNLPHLPKNISDILVAIAPYFAIIGGIVSLLSVISLMFLNNTLFYRYSYLYGSVNNFSIVFIVTSLISSVLLITAFSDLLNKKIFGWRLLFWSSNVGLLSSLLTLNFVSAVISAAISWYLLFEMRSSYT